MTKKTNPHSDDPVRGKEKQQGKGTGICAVRLFPRSSTKREGGDRFIPDPHEYLGRDEKEEGADEGIKGNHPEFALKVCGGLGGREAPWGKGRHRNGEGGRKQKANSMTPYI